MGFYTEGELGNIGFRKVGKNVRLSKKVSIYNPSNISINDNSRIDDFCVLSAGDGGINIGKNVHIAAFSLLVGKGEIKIEDFAGFSSRVSIYSSSDDYSGEYMTNPTVSPKLTNVQHGPVYIGKHVIIGAGSTVLPNIVIGEGAAIGALSLVNKNCESFRIYAGNPIKYIKERSKKLLELEEKLLKEYI